MQRSVSISLIDVFLHYSSVRLQKMMSYLKSDLMDGNYFSFMLSIHDIDNPDTVSTSLHINRLNGRSNSEVN